MTWTCYQTTPATGAEAMYNIKTYLVSAGWVVKASGTGSSGTGSGTYNATGDSLTTAALTANVAAWFRIQDPAGVREYTFQRTTSNTTWRIKYSASAKFTGGSPAAAQTPSATDEAVKYGSGTDASPVGTALFGTEGAYRLKAGIGNAAESYGWWVSTWGSGTGAAGAFIAHDPLVAPSSSDGDPLATCVLSSISNTNLNGVSAYTGWLSNTRTVSSNHVAIPCCFYTSNNTTILPTVAGVNAFESSEDVFPIMLARLSSATAPTGYKGWSSIVRWTSTSRSVGTTLQSGTWLVIFGGIAVPWDGTTAITI